MIIIIIILNSIIIKDKGIPITGHEGTRDVESRVHTAMALGGDRMGSAMLGHLYPQRRTW